MKLKIKITILALTFAISSVPTQKAFAFQAVGQTVTGQFNEAANSAQAGLFLLVAAPLGVGYGLIKGSPEMVGLGFLCTFWCPFSAVYFLDSNQQNSPYYFQFKDLREFSSQTFKSKLSTEEIKSYQEEREMLNALSEQLVLDLSALGKSTNSEEERKLIQREYSFKYWQQYESQFSKSTFNALRKLLTN